MTWLKWPSLAKIQSVISTNETGHPVTISFYLALQSTTGEIHKLQYIRSSPNDQGEKVSYTPPGVTITPCHYLIQVEDKMKYTQTLAQLHPIAEIKQYRALYFLSSVIVCRKLKQKLRGPEIAT